MELYELWKLIEGDLEQAAAMLPASAANTREVIGFREYLSHNELGMACEMLEEYGANNPVPLDFWKPLSDAAQKMGLKKQAEQYADWSGP